MSLSTSSTRCAVCSARTLRTYCAGAAQLSISADTVRLTSDEDKAAAQILASIGLLANVEGGYEPAQGMVELMAFVPATIRAEATVSILRQIAATAGILPNADAVGWASYDDETLLAQGRASSLGGRMLATIAASSTSAPVWENWARRSPMPFQPRPWSVSTCSGGHSNSPAG